MPIRALTNDASGADRSLLLTLIAATESVSLCVSDEKLTAFMKSAIRVPAKSTARLG
jgi:hypothetical protein